MNTLEVLMKDLLAQLLRMEKQILRYTWRIEVVNSGKPALVAVKKNKPGIPGNNKQNVPFDDVRLVINVDGSYDFFCFHFDLVRRRVVDITKSEKGKSIDWWSKFTSGAGENFVSF